MNKETNQDCRDFYAALENRIAATGLPYGDEIRTALKAEAEAVLNAGVYDIIRIAEEMFRLNHNRTPLIADEGLSALPWTSYLAGWSEANPRRYGITLDSDAVQGMERARTIVWHTAYPPSRLLRIFLSSVFSRSNSFIHLTSLTSIYPN